MSKHSYKKVKILKQAGFRVKAWCPLKSHYLLKQTCSFWFLVCLSMYDLLVDTGFRSNYEKSYLNMARFNKCIQEKPISLYIYLEKERSCVKVQNFVSKNYSDRGNEYLIKTLFFSLLKFISSCLHFIKCNICNSVKTDWENLSKIIKKWLKKKLY